MGISMSTLIGWVAVLGVFGGYTFREWNKKRQIQLARAEAQRQRQERQNPTVRREQKESKPRRPRPEDSTQGDSYSAKVKSPAPGTAPAKHVDYAYSSDDDTARNREFARQLSNVKQGTKFAAKSKDETRQKSVKQSRAEELPVTGDSGRISAPSSTAGIDADDDRSSAASPVLVAVEAGNVDDMLEAKSPGPSVLRLTGTEEKKPNKKTTKASPEPSETKKQRQNRKKAELAKAEREEAEKDRKQKQEAQRRLARQSEGRAAKDGSAFMAAQTKQSNAWAGNGANGKSQPTSSTSSGTNGFVPVQPLDTFDANAVQTDASRSSVPSYDKNDDWMSSLPSEEEQMELLRKEETDTWNTVKNKARKNKSKEATAENTNASPLPAKPTTAPTVPTTVSGTSVHDKKRPAKISNQSSFAALSTDGPGEDEEEEWDV